jgi:hypothetical protein
MRLKELISEAPLGQTIGKTVGKAAFGAGNQAGKAVGTAVALDKSVKAAGSAFDQGRGGPGIKQAPSADSESPFDTIPDKDAKYILANIINGKPLDQNQMAMVKKVYNKL